MLLIQSKRLTHGKKFLSGLTGLICWFICSISYAYSISPIIVHLKPQGSGAKQAVDIINDSDEPIAIEVTARERIIDANGKDSLAEIDDKKQLFAIYPSQLIVKPNSTRTIQVQYIGDKNIKNELAYKLIFEELKINMEKPNTPEQGGIDFLIKYQASLYVTPSNAKPNVVIKSIKSIKDKKKMLLTLENTGNAHKIINIPQIMRGNIMVLDEKRLIGLIGGNLLAKGIREYEIEVENDVLLDNTVNFRFHS